MILPRLTYCSSATQALVDIQIGALKVSVVRLSVLDALKFLVKESLIRGSFPEGVRSSN